MPISLPQRILSLQTLAARWSRFMMEQLWLWDQPVDGQTCMVYGTGNSSWGAWAQINAAIYASHASQWSDDLFSAAPQQYRTQAQRRAIACALIRYALGYHTTGLFNGASNNRWGGVHQSPTEKELYENWHSPLWTSLLAQAVFALGNDIPPDIHQRLKAAVAHDAQAQTLLGVHNFDGSAEEQEGKKSHPESNAWKAALLTLARGLCPDDPCAPAWREREQRLWASSFAIPGDDANEQQVDGQRVKDLVVGSHLTPSFTVIHHRFLHPCYHIFSLLPRMLAAMDAARLNVDYPQAAARHEAPVFERLMQMTLPGRIVYPAGKDWPRWGYGQAYLLPLLAHRMRVDHHDHSQLIDSLIATRQRDAHASDDGSMILHRFPRVLEDFPWTAHRFETDMAASLAMTVGLLSETETRPGRPPQPRVEMAARCHEPLAKTVYERRPEGFFAMSTRAHQGPVQLTALPTDNPHLLEWRGNGFMGVKLRGAPYPDMAVLGDAKLQLHAAGGFTGWAAMDFAGSPTATINPALYTSHLIAHLPAEHPLLLVHQQLTSHSRGFVDRIDLHRWRIAQSVHNDNQRTITGSNTQHVIPWGKNIQFTLDSPWLCVDGMLCLSLLSRAGEVDPNVDIPLTWTIKQISEGPGVFVEQGQGSAWLEMSATLHRPRSARTCFDEPLATSALVVSIDGQPRAGTFTPQADHVQFDLSAEGRFTLPRHA